MVVARRGRAGATLDAPQSLLVIADHDETERVSSWSIPAHDRNILYGDSYHFIEVVIYKENVPRCIVFGTSSVLSRDRRLWEPLLQSLQFMKKHGVRQLRLEGKATSPKDLQRELLEPDSGSDRRATAFAYNNGWSVDRAEPSTALLRHLATGGSRDNRMEVDAFLLTRGLAWKKTLVQRRLTAREIALTLAVIENQCAAPLPGQENHDGGLGAIDFEGVLRYGREHGFDPCNLSDDDAVAFVSHGDAQKYPYMQSIGAAIMHFRRCYTAVTTSKIIADDRRPPIGLVSGASHVDQQLRGIAEFLRRHGPGGGWQYSVFKGLGSQRQEGPRIPLYRLPSLHEGDPSACKVLNYLRQG